MQAVRKTSSWAYRCQKRLLSTSSAVYGRRSREPWDKRFPVRAEDVSPDKTGGSEEMAKALPEDSECCVIFLLKEIPIFFLFYER